MGFISALTSFFTRPTAPEPPVTAPAGSDGVVAYGGYITSGERAPQLQGSRRWVAYDNTLANTITVAAMARVWSALHRGAKWVVEPNKRGGRKAERAADLVREGLIEAPMLNPWPAVVAKAGTNATFRGAALHEQVLRLRRDGTWISDYLDDRPLHTIEQWDYPSEREPWRGVVQRTAAGSEFYIARERLMYIVDSTISNEPTGQGVLRHVTRSGELVERLEQLEVWGYELDLRGIPVGWAPIKELINEGINDYGINPKDTSKLKAHVEANTSFLSRILRKHVKDPELSIMLDSATYLTTAGDRREPSDVKKWDISTIKADTGAHGFDRRAIDAKNREMARLLGMEWLLMGGGEGSNAMHGDKTSMTGLIVNGSLEAIGAAATYGPARRLVVINGMDPDTCAPRVYPEPVPTETIGAVCDALAAIARAGAPLRPQDLPIVNAVLERMRLPKMEEPDPTEMMLPRAPASAPPGPPDPAKGEVDVDLGDEQAAGPTGGPNEQRKRRSRR